MHARLIHLRDKYKQNFQNSLNPICSCGLDVELMNNHHGAEFQ